MANTLQAVHLSKKRIETEVRTFGTVEHVSGESAGECYKIVIVTDRVVLEERTCYVLL